MATSNDKIKFIEKVFGLGRLSARSENIAVRCPICDPSDRSKRKLSIRLDDDLTHCWTCGWKSCNLYSLIIKYADRENAEFYKQVYLPEAHRRKLVDESVVVPMLPRDYRLLALNRTTSDPDILVVSKYAAARGLTPKDMAYFALGCSFEKQFKRRLMVPSFDENGHLNYLVTRAIDDRTYPRYVNSENHKTDIVFNELKVDWTRKLNLVEGPFDLMKCPENSTCLLGSELNETHRLFSKILENGTSVVLCLDDDARSKADKIASTLASYNIDVSIARLPQGKDPGELSKSEMIDVLSTSMQWTREFSIVDRIRNMTTRSLRI